MTLVRTPASSIPESNPQDTPLPGARLALLLLLAINLFNYIDRQVLAAVETDIERALFPGQEIVEEIGSEAENGPIIQARQPKEKNAKFKMGLLSTAFLVTYMLAAPIFGWLADRMSRWTLVGVGVMIWSLASGASGLDWKMGLAAGFWLLLLTRCFVGVGEAAYGPVAPTMISDLFPLKIRGRVMAWFYLAIPVGSALGYALGGLISSLPEWFWRMAAMPNDEDRWRWAFFLVLPPGLLLGLICFLMRDPKRGQADRLAKSQQRPARLTDYVQLLKTPSYVLDTLGMTAMTFSLGALGYWMRDYLEWRIQKGEAPNLGPVNGIMVFGGITALAGFLGTLAGGIAGDRLRSRFAGSYFLVSGTAMLAGFPMVLLFLVTPFPWAWLLVFAAVFCLFFNTGPTNTILANVTHPSIRASAFAFNIFVIHLFGDAISPPVIGRVSEHSSRNVGFATVSLLMLVGGMFWLWGARFLEQDTELAPTRLSPDQ